MNADKGEAKKKFSCGGLREGVSEIEARSLPAADRLHPLRGFRMTSGFRNEAKCGHGMPCPFERRAWRKF
jgi:hypothetical protein